MTQNDTSIRTLFQEVIDEIASRYNLNVNITIYSHVNKNVGQTQAQAHQSATQILEDLGGNFTMSDDVTDKEDVHWYNIVDKSRQLPVDFTIFHSKEDKKWTRKSFNQKA